MTRLARLTREAVDDEQRRLFDEIVGGERSGQKPSFRRLGEDGALEGPFNAMLYSPTLGLALQALGVQVRYHSTLADRSREIAILTTAAEWGSEYERSAHEDIARAIGLTDDEIDAISTHSDPGFSDSTERVVLMVARGLAERHDLDDAEYAGAVRMLGEGTLFELVVLVGYYAAVALSLRVFRVVPPSPDGPSTSQ